MGRNRRNQKKVQDEQQKILESQEKLNNETISNYESFWDWYSWCSENIDYSIKTGRRWSKTCYEYGKYPFESGSKAINTMFDLYDYYFPAKSEQQLQHEKVIKKENSDREKLEQIRKKAKLSRQSIISDNYSRIYQKNNVFKFEHEMKGRRMASFSTLLLSPDSNNLKKFEFQVSEYSIKSWADRLYLNFSYMDWLAATVRTMRTQTFKVTFKSLLG